MRTLKFLIILLIILLLLCPAQVVLGAPKDPNDDKAPKDDKQNQSDQENKTNQGNQDSKDNKTNQTTSTTQSSQANQGNSGNDKEKKDKKDKPDQITQELVYQSFAGGFLDFNYSLTEDKLVNISVYNIRVFNVTLIENASFDQEKVSNHLYKADGPGAKLIGHDNPLTIIEIKASKDITVRLNITENFTIKQISDNEVILVNDSVNITLRLLGKPGSIILNLSQYNLSIFLPKSSKLKIHIINISKIKDKEEAPGILWFEETKQLVFNAIYDESFAGDATITGPSQAPSIDINTYIDDFIFDVNSIKSDTHEITIQIASDDPAGKFILLSSLKESLGLPLENYSNVKILIDNDEIPEVPDPSLMSTSKAGYYRSFDNEAEQVMISVPNFSEHTITIEFIPRIIPEEIRPEKVWGYLDFIAIMIILFVIIIAGVYLYLDRRE